LAIADAPAGERFAVAAATLALLDAAAESAPLLVLVDDAHWLDAASAEALLFAARRLQAEGMVLLFAARRGDGSFPAHLLEELPLEGLDRQQATELLADRAGRPGAPHVAGELAAQTGGNPLALLEVTQLLSEGQLRGTEPLPDPLPAGASAERAFGRRVVALEAPARQALLLAAAGSSDDAEAIWRAAGTLGLASAAFEQAEAAGLLTIDAAGMSFRHPLVRSTAYGTAPPSQRRAAHRALADALVGTLVADRRAWHLAAAALGPDEDAAGQLEAAAHRAQQRSGYAAAAAALQRAAALSPYQTDRLRRLLAAATAAHRAGHVDHAVRLLEEALQRTDEPGPRAAIWHTRGRIELFRGRARTAARLLAAEAATIRAVQPNQAARMLAEAALAAFLAGEVAEALTMTMEAQETVAGGGGVAELVTRLVTGTALFHAGQPGEGVRLLLAAADLAGTADPGSLEVEYVVLTALALMWAGELRRAEAILGPVLDEARQAGALGVLSYALYAACYLDLRVGRLATAAVSGTEAARLARDTGEVLFAYLAAGCLALVDAVRGQEDACRRHVADGRDLGRQLELDYPHDLADALGLLELGLGRSGEAIRHLEAANRVDALGGEPLMGRPSAPDLIEAYVRAGQPVPASMRRDLEAQSLDEPLAAVAAAAWRCRGLLADEASFDDCFARALQLHQATGMPWPTARTALAYGERLRRAGRRVDARVQLRLAAETFQRIGATPWAERAAGELRATGETVRRRDRPATEELTPQELQIALAVADGGTNREVGAALFLSAKTIEFHLSHVYRKLGVRSRTQLTRVLARAIDAQ
jgi:DNA-binding NarL/FixJ family response regulator